MERGFCKAASIIYHSAVIERPEVLRDCTILFQPNQPARPIKMPPPLMIDTPNDWKHRLLLALATCLMVGVMLAAAALFGR